MIRRPPRSTLSSSSAASDVYKRQAQAPDPARGGRVELGSAVQAGTTGRGRLAVFPAGADLIAAVAVCNGNQGDDQVPADDVGDLLLALVDKSLLQPAGGGLRYRMLETIREYGVERLAERAELDDARLRHARYFAVLTADLDPVLRTRDQLAALEVIRVERDNILGALRYLGDCGDGIAAVDLCSVS